MGRSEVDIEVQWTTFPRNSYAVHAVPEHDFPHQWLLDAVESDGDWNWVIYLNYAGSGTNTLMFFGASNTHAEAQKAAVTALNKHIGPHKDP